MTDHRVFGGEGRMEGGKGSLGGGINEKVNEKSKKELRLEGKRNEKKKREQQFLGLVVSWLHSLEIGLCC